MSWGISGCARRFLLKRLVVNCLFPSFISGDEFSLFFFHEWLRLLLLRNEFLFFD